MKRTDADKRRAVEIALADPEIAAQSDREIARICGVGHPFVASVRSECASSESSELELDSSSEPEKTKGADGKKRPVNRKQAAAQKQKILDAIKASPDASNLKIAKQVGCDDKTVASCGS